MSFGHWAGDCEMTRPDPPRVVEAWQHFCDMSASPYGDRLPLKWRLHEAFIHFLIVVPWNNRWRMRLLRLVPDKIAYWILIREGAKFGTGPDEITLNDMLKQMASRHKEGWG